MNCQSKDCTKAAQEICFVENLKLCLVHHQQHMSDVHNQKVPSHKMNKQKEILTEHLSIIKEYVLNKTSEDALIIEKFRILNEEQIAAEDFIEKLGSILDIKELLECFPSVKSSSNLNTDTDDVLDVMGQISSAIFTKKLKALENKYDPTLAKPITYNLDDKATTLTQILCRICYVENNTMDIVKLLNCGHVYCKSCIKQNIDYNLSEKNLSKTIKCPDTFCNVEIFLSQIELLVSNDSYLKISHYSLESKKEIKLVNCPQCEKKLEARIDRKLICDDANCSFIFCTKCLNAYHESENCFESFFKERIRELECLYGEDAVSVCPGCRIPYLKDDGCSHITCFNPSCKVDFCFNCCCYRSPTLEHGNHYHRPSCKFGSDYDGNDDKMKPKCSECKKAGKLCARPKDLRVPRRIAEDES